MGKIRQKIFYFTMSCREQSLCLTLVLFSNWQGTSRRRKVITNVNWIVLGLLGVFVCLFFYVFLQQLCHRELFQNFMLSVYKTFILWFNIKVLETAMYLEILEPDFSHLLPRWFVTTSPLLGYPSYYHHAFQSFYLSPCLP